MSRVALRGLFLIDKQGVVRHALVNDLPLGRNVDEALRWSTPCSSRGARRGLPGQLARGRGGHEADRRRRGGIPRQAQPRDRPCSSLRGKDRAGKLAGFVRDGAVSVVRLSRGGVALGVLSPEWVERHLGGGGLSPVWKASLFGVPLPLCSCGVIPVAASMRRHGASRAAAAAFLLSTPQTGVDSIAVDLRPARTGLRGVFRPVAALISGFFGGVLVLLFGESKQDGAARGSGRRPSATKPAAPAIAPSPPCCAP